MTTPTRLRHPTILYEEHSDTRSKAQKEKDLFLPGKEVEVFYDPANPQSSVLIKGIGLSWLAIGLGGISFILSLVVFITRQAGGHNYSEMVGLARRAQFRHALWQMGEAIVGLFEQVLQRTPQSQKQHENPDVSWSEITAKWKRSN